jgi:hypothetical protein
LIIRINLSPSHLLSFHHLWSFLLRLTIFRHQQGALFEELLDLEGE